MLFARLHPRRPVRPSGQRKAGRLARTCNEYAAENDCATIQVASACFATLSMLDVDATLKEIGYAFDTLKEPTGSACRAVTATNGSAIRLTSRWLEELNRPQAVVLRASASRELLQRALSVGTFPGGDRSPARPPRGR